jgi:hypothetical protein
MEILKNKIKDFQKSLNNDIIVRVLSPIDIREDIADLNRFGQLFQNSEDSNGVSLDIYSDYTYSLKLEKFGTFPRNIVLFETGEFYNSFKVKINKDSFEIQADTLKGNDDLIEKYGEDILGLTDESKDKLIEIIKPLIIDEILRFD